VFRLAFYIPHRSRLRAAPITDHLAMIDTYRCWRVRLAISLKFVTFKYVLPSLTSWNLDFISISLKFVILKYAYTYYITIMRIVHTFFVNNFKYFNFYLTIFFLNSIFSKILRKKTGKITFFYDFFKMAAKYGRSLSFHSKFFFRKQKYT